MILESPLAARIHRFLDQPTEARHLHLVSDFSSSLGTERGLHEQNIEVSQYCTFERTDLFYSYRREGKTAGRWALLAAMA